MTAPAAHSNHGVFLRTRLGSLLAVMPLGAWTVAHLWSNISAFRGAEAWEHEVTEYSHPIAFFVTSLVALLPLVLHSVWGVGRILSTRPNNARYAFAGNLKYALQRLSAVGLLLFLGAHVWLALIHPRFVEGHPEAFSDISHEMRHHGPTLAVYVLGILGVSYHLANGLQTFAMGWGLVSSRNALQKLERLVLVAFALLLAMGWGTVYALWDAGR